MKNVKTLNKQELHAIKGGYSWEGPYYDQGGRFFIVDDGQTCTKTYVNYEYA